MARELVIHVLLLLYCHQVHFTQNFGDHVCSGPLLCLLIPPLIGGALFCIWSCKFNVYEQKWVTCRHSLCGNKENIFILIFFFFLFLLTTMHTYMNFIVPRWRKKCTHTLFYIIHILDKICLITWGSTFYSSHSLIMWGSNYHIKN